MRTFAVVTLCLLSTAAFYWYIAHSIRERTLGMGKYFGSQVTFHWPDQPLRFLLGLLFNCMLVALLTWMTAVSLADVEPPLFALWPGILGPIAAFWLSSHHYGEPAHPEVLAAFSAHVLAGDRQAAQKLVEERTRPGSTRRMLEAALGVESEGGTATDYRSAAVQSSAPVTSALEQALRAERRRGRWRLLPAAAALGACLVMLARPPRVDLGAAWAVAGAELVVAVWAVFAERRRSRRQGEVLATLRAALRSG